MSSQIHGDFITLARVIKTQGRHGEVAVEVHSDVPDRFSVGLRLFALDKQNARRELQIEDFWPHRGLLVLKFASVDSMNDAEALIGAELQVPRCDRAGLEQGWNYVSDLVGCAVLDHGREIGRIEDVQFGAGEAPLLIVVSKSAGAAKDGEVTKYDVPFAEAYLEGVDIAQKQVRMNLPEGLLEVNSPVTAEEKESFERARLKPRRKGSNR